MEYLELKYHLLSLFLLIVVCNLIELFQEQFETTEYYVPTLIGIIIWLMMEVIYNGCYFILLI